MSMSQSELEKRLAAIRDAVDVKLVGDNVSDIAEFTLEKFEFRTGGTLSAKVRQEALAEIKDLLWQRVERLQQRQQEILADMINAAEAKLGQVVDRNKRASSPSNG